VKFTAKPPEAPLLGTYPGEGCGMAPERKHRQSGISTCGALYVTLGGQEEAGNAVVEYSIVSVACLVRARQDTGDGLSSARV
jgi:hypothetical protein